VLLLLLLLLLHTAASAAVSQFARTIIVQFRESHHSLAMNPENWPDLTSGGYINLRRPLAWFSLAQTAEG
jgi:hypothetical protein